MRILCFLLAVFAIQIPASGQRPSPVVEFSSILTSLDVYHHDGRLALDDDNAALATAFLPPGTPVDVVITEAGSNQPLVIQPMAIAPAQGVFNRLGVRSPIQQFKFSKPGQYVATYRAGGKPMTIVPFSVTFEKNDDQFDPKTHVYLDGPWDQWAYLFASVAKGSAANPELRFWVRKKSFLGSPEADQYTAQIRRSGNVIAESDSGASNSKKWQFMRLPLRQPRSKGGGFIQLKEIVTADGNYQVLLRRNDEPYATFTLKVRQGQIVMHPRQQANHQPRTEYIVPRFPGLLGTLGDDSAGHAFWLKRDESSQAAESDVVANKGPSQEDLQRWEWLPRSIDPNRDFKLTVTDISTRSDTHLAAGEDLIVFGTGFPNGVAYMKVGDKEARQIPHGETYNAKVFGVCGKKIVLVRGKQIVIFDSGSNQLTAIPESEVSLYSPSTLTLRTNGFLVGTINHVDTVSDKTILKVIDLSGPSPVVIPINNGSYTHREVTSVSVDAKHGAVAISSQSRKLIAAAPIAKHARQFEIPVHEYRGVGPQMIFLEDEWICYADEDWKVRLLKLGDESPQAITDQAFPRAGNGFFVRKGRLAVATTDEKVGSRYRFAIGDLDDAPAIVKETGSPIAGTSGGLGMGGSAAIAIDKTVFIAGTAGDSIGVGEHLQLLDDDAGWIPVIGPNGKPLAASEVVTSMGLLAFKTLDSSRNPVIGFATYGQRVGYKAQAAPSSPNSSKTNPAKTAANRPTKPSPPKKLSEIDEAFLAEMLKNEKTIYEAYKTAFGAEEAKKKVLEGSKQVFENAGRKHLIDEYFRRSPLNQD